MQVEQLAFDKAEAAKLLRKYKEHRAWQTPVDFEIERLARLIEKGETVIRGAGSVVKAGLREDRLPKLAIARADVSLCYFRPYQNGGGEMISGQDWIDGRMSRSRYWKFASGSFPGLDNRHYHKAILPHIPPDIRPRRGIENYTLIWEAEWTRHIPVDPILCRRIGNSDIFLVIAQWDLTPIERMVLQDRLGRQ